jgi:D-amino peptidase
MMEGLDETFDGCLFLGYHAAIATPGVLSHTYNPRAVAGARLGGITTGEAGLNALVGQHFGVPVAVITGDQYVGPEAAPFCPGLVHVPVKESVSRYATRHLHPNEAREAIRTAVHDALSIVDTIGPPQIAMPATLQVDLANPDMAEQATWLRGVSRVDSRTVSVTDDDPLRLFGTFVTLVYLTRSLVESR